VFERDDRIGGLLRYGIPDFKMEKWVLDRRLKLMEEEGVVFRPGVNVGVDVTAEELRASFDAVLLCGGATRARDLACSRARAGRRRVRDGLPAAAEQARGGRRPDLAARRQRRRQARRHPRRGRHRLGTAWGRATGRGRLR
jgi:NADPH-dependent glutamate synthase beta subunit-like oxidoreductase